MKFCGQDLIFSLRGRVLKAAPPPFLAFSVLCFPLLPLTPSGRALPKRSITLGLASRHSQVRSHLLDPLPASLPCQRGASRAAACVQFRFDLIEVMSGSVRIKITLAVPSSKDVTSVASRLRASFSSEEAASTALDLDIVSLPNVAVVEQTMTSGGTDNGLDPGLASANAPQYMNETDVYVPLCVGTLIVFSAFGVAALDISLRHRRQKARKSVADQLQELPQIAWVFKYTTTSTRGVGPPQGPTPTAGGGV